MNKECALKLVNEIINIVSFIIVVFDVKYICL